MLLFDFRENHVLIVVCNDTVFKTNRRNVHVSQRSNEEDLYVSLILFQVIIKCPLELVVHLIPRIGVVGEQVGATNSL